MAFRHARIDYSMSKDCDLFILERNRRQFDNCLGSMMKNRGNLPEKNQHPCDGTANSERRTSSRVSSEEDIPFALEEDIKNIDIIVESMEINLLAEDSGGVADEVYEPHNSVGTKADEVDIWKDYDEPGDKAGNLVRNNCKLLARCKMLEEKLAAYETNEGRVTFSKHSLTDENAKPEDRQREETSFEESFSKIVTRLELENLVLRAELKDAAEAKEKLKECIFKNDETFLRLQEAIKSAQNYGVFCSPLCTAKPEAESH
eukprot:857323_1